jgi:hypothetical protein
MSDEELIDVVGMNESNVIPTGNQMLTTRELELDRALQEDQGNIAVVNQEKDPLHEALRTIRYFTEQNAKLNDQIDNMKIKLKEFQEKSRLENSHKARKLKPFEQLSLTGKKDRINKVKNIIIELSGSKESIIIFWNDITKEFDQPSSFDKYTSLAIKNQLHLSDDKYHKVLHNAKYDLPFSSLYAVKQAKKEIRESNPYLLKNLTTSESQVNFTVVSSAKTAIQLIFYLIT